MRCLFQRFSSPRGGYRRGFSPVITGHFTSNFLSNRHRFFGFISGLRRNRFLRLIEHFIAQASRSAHHLMHQLSR